MITAEERLLGRGPEGHVLSSEHPSTVPSAPGCPDPPELRQQGQDSLILWKPGERQAPAAAGLSYPAAEHCPLGGEQRGLPCAAGQPPSAPAESPATGSAAAQWSPAEGESTSEHRKAPTEELSTI